MKRLLPLVTLVGAIVAGLSLTTVAGQFVIRSPDTILWQSAQDAILVLHNSTDKLVSQIVLDFPGKVQVEHFTTNDGVMELQQQGIHIVLSGALLENGSIQLRWRPGTIPPLTAVITGDGGTHTLTLTNPQKWVAGPTELEMLHTASTAEALITRTTGETATMLTLKFATPLTHASAIGIGCTPKLTLNKDTIAITGIFPNGATIDLKWTPPTARLLGGDWNDRPLYIAAQSEGITFNMPFSASTVTVTTGTPVRFVAPLTHGVKNYSWNFGDGTTATGANVTHAFDHAGQYLVTLQEVEANGKTHLRQRLIDVYQNGSGNCLASNIAPDAILEGPYGPYPLEFESRHWVGQEEGYWDEYGYTVDFDASASYAPNGKIVKYQWDFGDGQTAVTTTPYVSHHYEFAFNEGPVYFLSPNSLPQTKLIRIPVTLTVTDSNNRTSTSTMQAVFIYMFYTHY